MPFLFYDTTMLIIIPALLLSIYAQTKVSSNFNKYGKILSSTNFTGESIAKAILSQAGIHDVRIERFNGSSYGDHYDPRTKVIRLSDKVYSSNSIAALGIAAHECGHAIQHNVGYVPNKIRTAFVPLANLGSTASIPLFFIGILFTIESLQIAGIIFFALTTLFYLITLPVEFNASSRAVKILSGYMPQNELSGVKNVLSAAALTYLAAALMSLLQLLRLIIISRRDN